MAAGNATLYANAVYAMGQAGFNFSSDNFNAILLPTTYSPQVNTDALYSDVSSFELASGGGYAAGGQALTGVSWTQSQGTSTLAAQSALWNGATFAARYCVIARRASINLAPTDRLLCYLDLTGGGNGSATASLFQVNFNNASTLSSASTVFTFTHNP